MTEHSNSEAIRRAYEAFNKGDVETLREMLAEDIVWHVPGRSSLAGTYRGRDATLAYFGRMDELTEGSYHAELGDVVGNGELVVSIDRSSGRRGEVTYDETEVVVFR